MKKILTPFIMLFSIAAYVVFLPFAWISKSKIFGEKSKNFWTKFED